jgi:hypothetical protein
MCISCISELFGKSVEGVPVRIPSSSCSQDLIALSMRSKASYSGSYSSFAGSARAATNREMRRPSRHSDAWSQWSVEPVCCENCLRAMQGHNKRGKGAYEQPARAGRAVILLAAITQESLSDNGPPAQRKPRAVNS